MGLDHPNPRPSPQLCASACPHSNLDHLFSRIVDGAARVTAEEADPLSQGATPVVEILIPRELNSNHEVSYIILGLSDNLVLPLCSPSSQVGIASWNKKMRVLLSLACLALAACSSSAMMLRGGSEVSRNVRDGCRKPTSDLRVQRLPLPVLSS